MKVNHEKQLAQLPIPRSVRLTIPLQQSVPIQEILDKIQDSESDHLGCEHLINQQEIRNIWSQLNLHAV